MLMCIIGGIAFVLFAIYDLEQAKVIPHRLHKGIKFFFSMGFLCLLFSTVLTIYRQALPFSLWGMRQAFALSVAAVFLFLLLYTLFFALPFEETYMEQVAVKTYDKGVYALCRHPGVLWFFGLYFCFWMAFGGASLFWMAAWYSFLNLSYIILQDCCTFPRIFSDYKQYKQKVPFLIPTPKSIQECFSTLRKAGDNT